MIIRNFDKWINIIPEVNDHCKRIIAIVRDFRYLELSVAAKFCLSLMATIPMYKTWDDSIDYLVTDYKSAYEKIKNNYSKKVLEENRAGLKKVFVSYHFVLEDNPHHSEWL